MPLMGIADYSPCHSWLNMDRSEFDSGPVGMRLREEALACNSSPAFPACEKVPSSFSSTVAPPTSDSPFSYHQLLQANADIANGSAVFSQKQQAHLQQPIANILFERQYSKQQPMPKMINEPFAVNHRAMNGFGQDPKQLLSYFLVNNSNTGIDSKLALNGMVDQMNGGDSYYRWLQQNGMGARQQVSQAHQQSPSAFYGPDYDPWHFQPINGQNGHCNGFSTSPISKKSQLPATTTGGANGFYEHSNGTRTGSSSASSSSSCYSSGNAGLLTCNSAKNGFPSNGMVHGLVDSNMDVQAGIRAKRSTSLTPPNDTQFDQHTSYDRGNQQRSAMNVPWLTGNGHDDVFSNMNTFDVQALHQNDDGREYYGRQENGFSPEQSRNSGSGSGSMSGCEQPESPVQHRNTFLEPGSGMRNVKVWLKNLRLHKYEPLFSRLTYDEMMHLTLEQLAEQKIVEGARKKIVLSIQKLRERVNLLKQLEREMNESGGMKAAAVALKSMVDTPIRPYTGPAGRQNLVDVDQTLIDGLDVDVNLLDEENLPAHFSRVLYKTCCKILDSTSTGLDDECVGACLFALDRSLNDEAFTVAQKRRLASLKPQIRRLYATMPRKLAPRSNSWNKDRRQSVGGNGHCGMANRTPNSNSHPLHRQSSLGTNGLMTSYSRSITDSNSSAAYVQSRMSAQQQMNHMQNINGTSLGKVIEQTNHTTAPSYASAVLGSMNGQKMQKNMEREEVTNVSPMQQCRPVQRTISAPPLRQTGAAGGSQVAVSSANTSSNMASNANQAGACVSVDGTMMPAYCWPPSSVFSAGPIMPPSPSPSRLASAWSCGFEEATSTRATSYQAATMGYNPIFQNQQRNAFGTGFADSSGNKNVDEGNGLFGPVVGVFNADWNSRLEQLCRSITDATIGGN